jgi:hypothetical protein
MNQLLCQRGFESFGFPCAVRIWKCANARLRGRAFLSHLFAVANA